MEEFKKKRRRILKKGIKLCDECVHSVGLIRLGTKYKSRSRLVVN